MCCFSGSVDRVSATKIFARLLAPGRQGLVYQMSLKSRQDVAMILPLPVVPGTQGDAIHWVDLSQYPQFFSDLDRGFPVSKSDSRKDWGAPPAGAALPVVEVGNFEASFVPSLADFHRLDERFRLSDVAQGDLPEYLGWAFAVFKLKAGDRKIHPMAFSFPTAAPRRLFFPTLHVHDGKVHDFAEFDHVLYAQPHLTQELSFLAWTESDLLPPSFMDQALSKDLLSLDHHVYRRSLHGRLENEDTWVRSA